MKHSTTLHTATSKRFCAAGFITLAALAALSLFVGKYPLSMDALLSGDEMQWRVFVTLRCSRAIVGVAGGFALGVAGFIYQTVFRNPLASPDIIGVSSGASAGAAAGILFLSGAASVTLAAFGGALLAAVLPHFSQRMASFGARRSRRAPTEGTAFTGAKVGARS